MSTDRKVVVGGGSGVSFLTLLGLLFIGLKLGHVIEWSWLWVTCPLWGGIALWACLFVGALFLALVAAIFKGL
jgi:hypothetical protein